MVDSSVCIKEALETKQRALDDLRDRASELGQAFRAARDAFQDDPVSRKVLGGICSLCNIERVLRGVRDLRKGL